MSELLVGDSEMHNESTQNSSPGVGALITEISGLEHSDYEFLCGTEEDKIPRVGILKTEVPNPFPTFSWKRDGNDLVVFNFKFKETYLNVPEPIFTDLAALGILHIIDLGNDAVYEIHQL